MKSQKIDNTLSISNKFSTEKPIKRISKSELRDPQNLELATHGVVEVRTGGEIDIAMLPISQLKELEKFPRLFQLYLQATAAMNHPDSPRALLGDAAFVLYLDVSDREAFIQNLSEVLFDAIQFGNSERAEFVIDSYREAVRIQKEKGEFIFGALSPSLESAFRDFLAQS